VSWLNRRIDEGIREMSASIPGELLDLFAEPALGVVSYTTVAGQIVPFSMWVDYDGTHLLASSPMGSKKGRALRVRPQVGVVIVSAKTP
jgi:nitroimidazol reductase NimA-like FMN-containing flavoprotein (pyridoxamine 5'-phosphate oxidase superfamily)